MKCPAGCSGGYTVLSLFDRQECSVCRGKGVVADAETAREPTAAERQQARLLAARLSGIRDARRILLQEAVTFTAARTKAHREGHKEAETTYAAALRTLWHLWKKVEAAKDWTLNEEFEVGCTCEPKPYEVGLHGNGLDPEKDGRGVPETPFLACGKCGKVFDESRIPEIYPEDKPTEAV